MSSGVKYIRPRSSMRKLFVEADDQSLDLYFCVSYSCDSQTGEGFREFVDTMNRDDYARKIKELRIVDTCYLYRHTIPEFTKYSDPNIETEWEKKNRESIDALKCNHRVIHWCELLDTDQFRNWYKIVKKDFDGNGNINDIDIDFRDLVIKESAISSQRGHGIFDGCREFLIEETACSCALFHNVNLIYPGKMSEVTLYSSKKYKRNMVRFVYSLAKHTSTWGDAGGLTGVLETKVTDFMMNQISHVNFFVIDKHGRRIYKNYALDSVIGEINAKSLGQSWENTKRVIETGEEMTVEERYNDNYYLSFKTPLIIDGRVEGVIGLAIDITDKKKSECLEVKNKAQDALIKRQASFEELIARAVHDLRSPLVSLDMLSARNSLPEKEHITLRSAIAKVREVCNVLLLEYKENKKAASSLESRPVLVPLLLTETVSQTFSQQSDPNLKVTCSYDPKDYLTYVSGDQILMGRMLSNLVSNAVEATADKKNREVEVSMVADNLEVKIVVKDNGRGMPHSVINRIYDRIPVETTKRNGNGLGLGQILSVVDRYGGTLEIDSQEGVGTSFSVAFQKIAVPKYVQNKITLNKGDVVLCLDDDPSVRYVWENVLHPYRDSVSFRFFTTANEAGAFVEEYERPNDIFIASDYELRGQDTNGLYFILENSKRNKSIIVTSINDNIEIVEKIECAGVNMFPKQFLNRLEIEIKSA